jgi:hypothetical protein
MVDSSDTILKREKAFWRTLVDKDTNAAKAMIADECLVTGPSGTLRNGPAK